MNSVSALGRLSRYYTEKHDFDEPEGAESPVGRLYSNDGKILLINVGLTSCTAIHLAEYIADVEYLYRDNPVVLRGKVDGVNEFVSIKKYPGVSEYFDNIIPDLKAKHLIKENNFKQGRLMLFSIRPVVDYIVSELNSNSEYLITKNIRKD